MAVPIPFPYIRSLPKADQQRLKRDFDAVLAQITSTKVYDAYVDGEAIADNTDTRTFTTPFAAIKYVRETLGRVWVNIGWVKPATGNPLTVAETGNYGGTNTVFVTIDVIGADDAGSQVIGGASHNAAQWDLQGFSDSSKFVRVRLRGISLNSTLAGPSTPFSNASLEIAADNCYFNFGQHAVMNPSGQTGFFRNCTLQGATWSGTGLTYMDHCWISNVGGATPTVSQSWVTHDCHFSNLGSVTFTGTIYIMAEANFTQYSAGSALTAGTLNFTSASTVRIYITTGGDEQTFDQAVTVNIAAAIQYVWLEGNFWSVTKVAPPASSGASQASLHHVAVHCERFFDITGPAMLSISAQFGANFLRGEGLSGAVLCGGNLSSGVGLSFVGVHDSTIMASFQAYSTAGTGIAYSIDAASSNNVIIVEGHALFTSGSTNSSTTTIVVRHDSTFPINGRDSTGDALNKDMLPAWMGGEPLPGVTTLPTPAPGSSPTGVAGGSLAGTYPNPTFAGRDVSVDKINQDMLPSLLADPNGVSTIPSPAATAAVDLRDFQHEWIAELATGVQTIPTPAPGSSPTGTASGSLAGTYPSPTLAGRDASVDALNKDLLPGLLTDPNGVSTTPTPATAVGGSLAGFLPNPTLAGRDNSTDAINKDILPAILTPPQGVSSPQGMLDGFIMPAAAPTLAQVLAVDNFASQRWIWKSPITTGFNVAVAGSSLRGTVDVPTLLTDVMKPSGAYETFPRFQGMTNQAALATGRVQLVAIALPIGFTITNLSFASATTAAGTPTHWWMSICNSSFVTLRSTADQLTTAIAANTLKTVALSTPFVTTTAGLHYIALMVTATTVPTILGNIMGIAGTVDQVTPRACLTGNTGLTTAPADGTNLATAPAANSVCFYGYAT